MTTFYLMRHGKTLSNQKKKIIGWDDPDILIEEINFINNRIKKLDENIDFILSSPLKRALHTAKIISQKLNKKIIIENNLKEINYGSLQGMLKTKAKIKYPLYHNNPSFNNIDGESFYEMQKRVSKVLKKYENKNKKILIITHAGCIRAILSHYNNVDLKEIINIKISHDKIIKINFP